jgi:hypothetical protein
MDAGWTVGMKTTSCQGAFRETQIVVGAYVIAADEHWFSVVRNVRTTLWRASEAVENSIRTRSSPPALGSMCFTQAGRHQVGVDPGRTKPCDRGRAETGAAGYRSLRYSHRGDWEISARDVARSPGCGRERRAGGRGKPVPRLHAARLTKHQNAPTGDFPAGAEVFDFRAAYTARNMVLPWRLTRSRVLSFAVRIAVSNSVVLCTG